MKVLIDTSFIYGLFIKRSPNHENAQKKLERMFENGPSDIFLTINYVVQESYAVFCNRIHNSTYLNTLDDFFYGKNCFFEILYVRADKTKDQEISKIMKENRDMKPKKVLSFVDASLIYMAKEISADAILSFDRHFEKVLPYYN
jgi:predicted nucleic acid-binding protein